MYIVISLLQTTRFLMQILRPKFSLMHTIMENIRTMNLLEIFEKDAKKEIEEDLMRVSNSNLMIPITLRIKELLIMRKNRQK